MDPVLLVIVTFGLILVVTASVAIGFGTTVPSLDRARSALAARRDAAD